MLRGSNRLSSSTDCQEKNEAVRIKLEFGSETIGLTSSPAKLELGSETIGPTSSPVQHCGLRISREIEEVKESLRTVKDTKTDKTVYMISSLALRLRKKNHQRL